MRNTNIFSSIVNGLARFDAGVNGVVCALTQGNWCLLPGAGEPSHLALYAPEILAGDAGAANESRLLNASTGWASRRMPLTVETGNPVPTTGARPVQTATTSRVQFRKKRRDDLRQR